MMTPTLPRRPGRWKEAAFGAVGFYLSLFLLPFVLFLGQAVLPFYFMWEAVFTVFPHTCPGPSPSYGCADGMWFARNWSYFTWAAIALGFGWITRGWSVGAKLMAAVTIMIATLLLHQAIVRALGWSIFVDTL